ncbi:hypothetical protein ACTJKC_01925 [Pedobacter sp. 22226]|uniref:hypothetical protein n=1 Tax=Pedobacter sp. 22226 TaxID=3453894 RepID=UPI003F87F354
MINIPTDSLKIAQARHDFLKKMRPLVTKRITTYNGRHSKRFLRSLIPDIDKILIGEPSDLEIFNNRISGIATANNIKAIRKVFDYEWFIAKTKTRYSAYHLAKALEVNVCVYCNRNYTHTVISKDKEKITRPQFDHFFNKKNNPLLALSFYNLIPSCSICNSGIKHEADFDLTFHNHPYVDDYIDDFSFTYKFTNDEPSGVVIKTETSNIKAHRTLKDLKTDLIYNTHSSELKELLRLKYAFSEKYLTILKANILQGTNIHRKELYNMAFGTEEDVKNFGNRPFSKFKNDILKELGII